MKTILWKLSGTVLSSSCLAAWWYRPVIDSKDGRGIARIGWISHFDFHNANCITPPLPFQFASSAITFIVVSASWIYLYLGGSYRVIEDENYYKFVEIMKNRDPDVPLITVSNHRSLLDDPLILSALLPFWMNCQPKYLRWGACAQEICFKEPNFSAAFFGVGKSLPMWRGGGIDQPLLLQLARKAVGSKINGQSADWIHVYPEAGVYQWKYHLGGRRNSDIGKLKWGVGKLIAHHPTNRSRHLLTIEQNSDQHNIITDTDTDTTTRRVKSPIVIPFYFIGTETITPFDDPIHRKVTTKIPQLGQKVVLRFGEPIYFHDLLDEFERNEVESGHVKSVKDALRVYTCCDNPHSHSSHSHHSQTIFGTFLQSLNGLFGVQAKEGDNGEERELDLDVDPKEDSLLMKDLESWKSTQTEKKLYHKITTRIEQKLEELGEKCVQDLE